MAWRRESTEFGTLAGHTSGMTSEGFRAYFHSTEADENERGISPHFSLLEPTPEERKRRWKALAVSPVLEACGVAILVLVAALVPPVREEVKQQAVVFHLVAPPLENPEIPKTPKMHVPPRPILREPPRLETPKQLVEQPRVPVTPVQPKPQPTPPPVLKTPEPPKMALATPKPVPPPAIHTGGFSTGSSAKPTIKAPIRQVQTGGFGNPEGLPGKALGGNPGNVPKMGSFDLPSGPGYGNGSGGAQGQRGVVASAGFGNGIATMSPGSGGGSGGGKRAVQSGGFADGTAPTHVEKSNTAVAAPKFEPVQILSKPNPVYPEEARKLKIEGEVLVDALFEATGKVRVLRVVQGLGHGMDDSAIAAAQQIAFKPARRNGQPVDSEATVHIFFQLAY
jgi:TonB family protein